jgi:hypothetical protein
MRAMVAATGRGLTAAELAAARRLAADLGRLFDGRLQSVVAYGLARQDEDAPLDTLALVDRCTFDDLVACAAAVGRWQQAGLNVPLLLTGDEFRRSLDAFPLEYGAILESHVVVSGQDPFEGITIARDDLRRECERRAKSHLIHLREGYLETGGRPDEVTALISRSAAPFRLLLSQIAGLSGAAAAADDAALAAFAERTLGVRAGLVGEVLTCGRAPSAIVDPAVTFAPYLAAVERIWSSLDAWPAS